MNFIIKKLIGAVISALPTLARAGSRPELTRVVTSVVPRNRNIKKKVRYIKVDCLCSRSLAKDQW
jgi:hypothetical protein